MSKQLTERQREIADEALLNATVRNKSLMNYTTIIRGFMDRGISPDDIIPRENVLTYHAWHGLGRQVRKGEKGIKVVTFIPTETSETKEDGTKKLRVHTRPWTTTVFHISQTDEL